MGKKGGIGYGGNKKPAPTSGLVQQRNSRPASLRQQSERGVGGATVSSSQAPNPTNQAAALRADHLLRVATWASANVPPLGALLGARLGGLCEAAHVPLPETPHVICERCESILQVGVNCSVRVTRNKRKGKSNNVSNYVTYLCHFCKHGNAKPGTSKKHLKTKIAQAAARSSLNLLGKSSGAKSRPVVEQTSPLSPNQESEQGHSSAEEERSGRTCLENQQLCTEQVCPEALESVLMKEPLEVVLDGFAEHKRSNAVEPSLEKWSSNLLETCQQGLDEVEGSEAAEPNGPVDLKERNERGFAEQEGARASKVTHEAGLLDSKELKQMECAGRGGARISEVSLDKEPLDFTEKHQPGEESAEVVEATLGHGISVLTERSEQGFPEPEHPQTVQVDHSNDYLGKTEHESVKEEGPRVVEVDLDKGSVENDGMNEHGFAEPEDLNSAGVGLNRLPLDLSSKKKRKKKHQQGPKMSPYKGFAVESSDSAKKKKRKGWLTLEDLASLP